MKTHEAIPKTWPVQPLRNGQKATDNSRWIIRSLSNTDDETGAPLFWSNADGWTSRDDATVFTAEERRHYQSISLVGGSEWERK